MCKFENVPTVIIFKNKTEILMEKWHRYRYAF